MDAVGKYRVPNRLRYDLGIENVNIARYMSMRGVGWQSVLSGSSTRNQRIELSSSQTLVVNK